MTAYPITVDSQTFDLSSMMGGQMGGDDGYGGKTHKTDGIYPDDRSVKQASSLTSSITENNLTRFKKYLDNSKSEIHQYVGSTGIQYTYDVRIQRLCLDGLADGVHKLVRHVRHLVDHLAADVDADRQNR